MEVQGHDTLLRSVVILWIAVVLNRVDADSTAAPLPLEVVVPIANREEILVPWVPADASNVLALCLLAVDSAEETDVGLLLVDVIEFAVREPIFVIIEDIELLVLHDSPLHDLQASSEALGIEIPLPLHLEYSWLPVFDLQLPFFILENLHVRIKDLPLCHFHVNMHAWWWLG